MLPLPVVRGYSGEATATYDTALQLIRTVTRRHDARFGIGTRKNRVVSLETEFSGQIVPNIFQMSSGETSLLNLFLSILRDFDLASASFSQPSDIRGIVLVDEIDLHLHAIHQHEVLPRLLQMFPRVQFIVTTHSPLFVLGMQNMFGDSGFELYRLPSGLLINPEEFSEFGDAYQVFKATRSFEDDMQTSIKNSVLPLVFVDGDLDVRYISRAAELLDRDETLARVSLVDGGGKGNLQKMWDGEIHLWPWNLVMMWFFFTIAMIPNQQQIRIDFIDGLFRCRDFIQYLRVLKICFRNQRLKKLVTMSVDSLR